MAITLSLFTTLDGSHSLCREDLHENYHSSMGAITESIHIYIEAGLLLAAKGKSSLRILEIGFGTGLNGYLTQRYAEEKNLQLFYHGLEPNPVPEELYEKLNYTSQLGEESNSSFLALHQARWNEEQALTPHFSLYKDLNSFQALEAEPSSFDLLYYDAFAPQYQAELWTRENFEKAFLLLNKGGILTTYCCKGEVKRNLLAAGFQIEKLPGPKGKREILRAKKP